MTEHARPVIILIPSNFSALPAVCAQAAPSSQFVLSYSFAAHLYLDFLSSE